MNDFTSLKLLLPILPEPSTTKTTSAVGEVQADNNIFIYLTYESYSKYIRPNTKDSKILPEPHEPICLRHSVSVARPDTRIYNLPCETEEIRGLARIVQRSS